MKTNGFGRAGVQYFCKIIVLAFFTLPHSLFAQTNQRVIPQPLEYIQTHGDFIINSATLIHSKNNTKPISQFLNSYLEHLSQKPLGQAKKAKSNTISISVDPKLVPQKEGYVLTVNSKNISITGHDEAGAFYGMQTLIQLIEQDSASGNVTVKGVTIADAPRFEYRGMHLDVSRHMFPVSFIKKYIDLLAFYKFNTFHWHLTDDQGWRLEIKQYPKLQTVAAYRNGTLIGHKKELPHVFDGIRYGGFYTQDEAREIVQYAAQRYITVIPEIEMPGHASAVLTAYPNLGCTGGPYEVAKFWGIFDEVFCAGNEESFTFLKNVLDEVMAIFPSKYIHVGGDECSKVRWKACAKCQKRKADEGLENEDELQSYFIKRIEEHLLKNDRNLVGWDEILEGGLSPGATVMSWRGESGAVEAAKHGNHAIMIPENHVYFDYYQSLHAHEPLASAGYTPLRKVYSYDPIPAELSRQEAAYIKGVQGAVWSEYLNNEKHAEYMVFPRMIAVSEIAWSPKEAKDYAHFMNRLDQHLPILKSLDVNYFVDFDEITCHVENGTLQLFSTRPEHQIYYTIDGRKPTDNDIQYTQPIPITCSGIITARLFENGQPKGRLFTKKFIISKATGKNISINTAASPAFAIDASVLLNGVEGTSRYNDKQWMLFSGDDFEAIIDFGKTESIENVGINILKYHWQRMWAPEELIFYGSLDGINFTQLIKETNFPGNGINQFRAKIPATKLRYVKVFAKNKGIVPEGEYGAGSKASLVIDEIYID